MQRIVSQPRENWQKTVESQGCYFHTLDGEPYWDESVYYQLSSAQVDVIEKATYSLNDMCLQAVQHVIDQGLFDQFQIPPAFVDYVVKSWDHDELTIYGRFDLAYDGVHPPKLLEYNADTPTSLLEAAVIQWFWFQDLHRQMDQFNSIHEKLIDAWRSARPAANGTMYFASVADNLEDLATVSYLRDTAMQAGLQTQHIPVEQIGWDRRRQRFVDLAERPIDHLFKLYPWEWMLREPFGPYLPLGHTNWLEAPWKMILSNKAILPVLYELFPDSPYLLPASLQPLAGSYARKPLLAREGANVTLVADGRTVAQTDGDYEGPYLYQELCLLPEFSGHHPLIGSWMVNGYACGMGIREDVSPITGNTSRFVPHVFC